MKKGMLPVILLLISGFGLHAQDQYAKNGGYLELGGNGGLYSLNYERFLSPDFSIRAGFASYSGESWWGDEETSVTTFPLLGNYFYGNGSNRLELGAGILLGSKKVKSGWGEEMNRSSTIFDLTAVVGYRYQKPAGGFIFRAGFTPFYALSGGEDAYPDEGFTPSGGISFGYAF